eukprot:6518523-Prymnesium_polylepis.1
MECQRFVGAYLRVHKGPRCVLETICDYCSNIGAFPRAHLLSQLSSRTPSARTKRCSCLSCSSRTSTSWSSSHRAAFGHRFPDARATQASDTRWGRMSASVSRTFVRSGLRADVVR